MPCAPARSQAAGRGEQVGLGVVRDSDVAGVTRLPQRGDVIDD